MKQLFTGLAFLAASLPTLAQPDCSEIIQASFTLSQQDNVVIVTNSSATMFPQSTTYQWYFGDGGTANGPVVTHVYDAPGEYVICLYAAVENCLDSVCQAIEVVGGPSPCDDLSAEFTMDIQGPEVSFENTVSSNLYTYQWHFGDGSIGYGESPDHTYPEPGTYAACLVVWTWDPLAQDTCFDENCEIVVIEEVAQPCDGLEAGFTASTFPFGAQFSNSTSGTGFQTSWNWSFGDGTFSTDPQPTHTYGQAGWYVVCLSAISIYELGGGDVITCVDSVCQEVFIPAGGSPCDSLSAYFTVSTEGNLAVFTTFTGNEVGHLWSFGDGGVSDAVEPTHVYPGPGTYNACHTTWSWDPETQDTCYADHCEWVTVAGGPCDSTFACFQWGLQNNTAQFFNCSSTNGEANYWWNFGDGGISDDPQPTHTYPGPGTYTVCLTVWSTGSEGTCSDTICNVLVVPGEPTPCDSLGAYFVVTTQQELAAFTSFGGTALGYHWEFGDGTVGDGPDPMHTYPGPGTYHACLITWTWDPQTQDTCYADHCEWITIGTPGPCDSLQACFQWSTQQNVIQFYNCSGPGEDLQYWWSFGDGTFSELEAPAHTYPGPGSYAVCLTVQTNIGPDSCSSTICDTVVIQGEPSPCDSLYADFEVIGIETQAVFSGYGGTAIGYQWTFGDGTEGDGPNPVHVYPGPGSYHACLVTWTWDPQTQDTCYADHCEWISIGNANPCDSLYACFQWGGADEAVQFYNCSGGEPGDLAYQWSFGDGTFSDAYEPLHAFPGPGTYTVCLTVTVMNAPDSCSDTMCNTVVIEGGSPCDGFMASFEWSDLFNGAVHFYGFSNPPANGYHWYFGDGTQGDGMDPFHEYGEPGEYHVCLTTWLWNQQTQDTCWTEYCEWIHVAGEGSPCDSLAAHFVWEPAGPNAFLFQDASETNGQPVSYWWSFGDGTYSDGPNPDHAYQQPGQYQVCLTITTLDTPDSCTSTTCQILTVQGGGSPCDGLNAEFSSSVNGFNIEVQGVNNPPGSTYQWLFGDGGTTNGLNATHTYDEPGTYNVCLIVGNYDPFTQDSCFEDHCQSITISGGGGPCDSLWEAHFEYGHQGNVYSFYNTSDTQGTLVSTHWDFGDGFTGDGSPLNHTYAQGGNYTVCMTITGIVPGTSDTCQTTVCEQVEVVLGIADADGASALTAWPLPFDEVLQLGSDGLHGLTRLTLLDMTGRVVDDRRINASGRIAIRYDQVSTGAYVLRVQNDIMDRSIRVVKR